MALMDAVQSAPGRWPIVGLPAAIAAYAGLAALVSPRVLIEMVDAYADETVILPPLLIVGLGVAGLICRPRAPLSFIIDVLKARLVGLVLAVAGLCVGLAAFTTLKLAIPRLVPFYADPYLADLDQLIHHGAPGLMAHAVLPVWADYPLAYTYGPVWFLLWFGLIGFIALHPDRALRTRYFWSMALVVSGIGTVLALALSSVGPIFYDRIYHASRFAELTRLVYASSVGPYMRGETNYLYQSYLGHGHAMGTGISAMPSIHVAIATLNAWMLTSVNRRVGIVAWLYVVTTMFCSVFLGWHYAVDGYVSVPVVSLIWWATGRIGHQHARGSASRELPGIRSAAGRRS